MGNRAWALIWAGLAVLAAAAGFFILQSNLVFALCFAGIAVAFLAIAGSCLLRDPPPAPPEDDEDLLEDPEPRPRRKWHPR